jgi:hypothetical protein
LPKGEAFVNNATPSEVRRYICDLG